MSLAQVVKIKKQALDSAFAQLNAAKARANAAQQELVKARERLDSLSELKPQTPNEIMLFSEHAALLRDQYAAAAERCELCKKEIIHYEYLYKRANIEYEKISALHAEELAAIKKERERKEALELDEIAIMLMSRQDTH